MVHVPQERGLALQLFLLWQLVSSLLVRAAADQVLLQEQGDTKMVKDDPSLQLTTLKEGSLSF